LRFVSDAAPSPRAPVRFVAGGPRRHHRRGPRARGGRGLAILLLALAALAACEARDIVIPGGDTSPVQDATGPDPGSDPTAADDAAHETPPGDAPDLPRPDPLTPDPLTPDSHEIPLPDAVSPPVCPANNDGRIDAAEMPVAIGAAPAFVANAYGTEVAVAVDPVDGAWDFTEGPEDVRTPMSVLAPGGFWFADRFPGATFVSPLSAQDPSVVAVYLADGTGVRLMGVASAEADPPSGRTLVVYDVPVPLFEFPLEVGRTYGATSSFKDALLFGIPNAGKEEYAIAVDAAGTLVLPAFTLHNTLRLRVEVSQRLVVAPQPDPIRSIQFIFVHECIGEVARISSPVNTTDPHFATAREFRRLSF